MAIKAGQIIHDVHGFVIDRIQTAGVNNVNIPQEKIYELGNYQTVATIRDIPDLSFDLESLDVSTEIESILVGKDPTGATSPSGAAAGTEFDFNHSMPLDVISPFKSGNGNFDIIKGIGLPYLTLEQAAYRFGVKANAQETFTLRGDSIYYVPGVPRFKNYAISGTGPYALGETALAYVEAGGTIYVQSVCLRNPTTGVYKRLFFGRDYTNTTTSFTLTATPDAAYSQINVIYGIAAGSVSYLQAVHQDTSVKPAAIRGKDIDVYIASSAATPTLVRWSGVQSFECTRRVNLENDEEFGNYHYVSSDYDTAEVNGNVAIKSVDATDLWAKIAQVANVSTSVIAGPFTSQPLKLEVRISDPDTGSVLKTLYVPDARFTIPGVQGRVQQKLTTTFNFESDSGVLKVYKGSRP